MEEVRQMAARIRELRDISGYDSGDMARMLGVDTALYEQFEKNGEDIPINILFRLSNILKVDLNEILTGQSPHLESYCLVKRGKGMEIDRYPGYHFHSLAYTYKHRVMEPLLVTVHPSDKDAALVTHGGQEFNICLEGTMELLFDGKVVRLEEGDSVYFNPLHPHGQRAVGGRARFLTVITG
jgi:transcriptional regulator with XRE-family HTH domain